MAKGEKQGRRAYTKEFKLEAVRLMRTGIPTARVSRDLGIQALSAPTSGFYEWVTRPESNPELLDESGQRGNLCRWFLHLLLLTALSCTLAACESAWPDLRQNPGNSLVLGTTTKDEVIARYGQPVERGAPVSDGLRMDAIGYYGRHFFDEPVVVPDSAPISYLTFEFYQGKLVSWSFASVYASDPTNFDIEKAKLIKPGDKSSYVRELIGEPSGRGIYPDSPKGTEMWHYWFAWTDGGGLHDWMLRVQIKSDGTVASSDLIENE